MKNTVAIATAADAAAAAAAATMGACWRRLWRPQFLVHGNAAPRVLFGGRLTRGSGRPDDAAVRGDQRRRASVLRAGEHRGPVDDCYRGSGVHGEAEVHIREGARRGRARAGRRGGVNGHRIDDGSGVEFTLLRPHGMRDYEELQGA